VTPPDTPADDPAPRPLSRWRTPSDRLLALVLALVSLALSLLLLTTRRPLGHFDHIADEWWLLGLNLAARDTLGLGDVPFTYRPPGYPVFIALVVRAFTSVPEGAALTPRYVDGALRIVGLAQCALLAASTAILYLWMRQRVAKGTAFAAALAFGTNPYCLLLCGLLHYDVLHILMLVLSTWATASAFQAERRGALVWLGCGILWGLTTLVRAVTLVFPGFLLLVLAARSGIRRGARRRNLYVTSLVTVGMLAALAPWTMRNYRLVGRLVPVNSEAWVAIWGSTVRPLPLDPNRYLWYLVADSEHFMPVVQRVTGRPDYSYYEYMRRSAEVDGALREEALRNLRDAPGIYVRNVGRSTVTFALQMNSLFLSVFERMQRPEPGAFPTGWPTREGAPERRPTAVSRSFDLFVGLTTLLAAWGCWAALRGRDPFVLVPLAVFVCVGAAHAIAYMDLMYYYVKMPFLLLLAGLGLQAVHERGWRVRGLSVATALAALLATWALASTAALWLVSAR
jgi:hypothetical protein